MTQINILLLAEIIRTNATAQTASPENTVHILTTALTMIRATMASVFRKMTSTLVLVTQQDLKENIATRTLTNV